MGTTNFLSLAGLALFLGCNYFLPKTLAAAVEPRSPYYASSSNVAGYGAGGLAQSIPLNSQLPPNLQQLYGSGAEQIYSLNFAQEPMRWNPYNNASEFMWYTPASGIPHDKAYISLSGTGPYAKKNAYGNAVAGTAALVTAPYQIYIPVADSANDTGYVEAELVWKNNVSVAADQRVVAEFQCSCKIYGAERHPFPANLVSHPNDDPRLANCFFEFTVTSTVNGNDTIAFVYFSITNKSIWAVYYADGFVSKRRVGIRRSYNDIVDLAIEYNAATNQYLLYVSGQIVWIISNPGQLPPADGVTKIDVGFPDQLVQDRATTLYFGFGTEKCLDESDPWDQADTTRLVKVTDDNLYNGNSVFYDPIGLRTNNLWGQAAKLTLYSVTVLRTSANATAASAPSSSLPYYANNNNNAYESF